MQSVCKAGGVFWWTPFGVGLDVFDFTLTFLYAVIYLPALLGLWWRTEFVILSISLLCRAITMSFCLFFYLFHSVYLFWLDYGRVMLVFPCFLLDSRFWYGSAIP